MWQMQFSYQLNFAMIWYWYNVQAICYLKSSKFIQFAVWKGEQDFIFNHGHELIPPNWVYKNIKRWCRSNDEHIQLQDQLEWKDWWQDTTFMESNLGDFLPASTCPTWWCDNCWESRQEPIQPIKGSHFYGRQLQQIRGNLTDFWSAPNLHCASNWYVAYCRVFCVTRIWRWQRKMLWFSFRWKGQFAAWQGLDCRGLYYFQKLIFL